MTNERIKTDNNKLLDNKIITFSKNSKLSSENVELQILGVLESLLSRSTKDDADALINWTLKSAREISTDLSKSGHQVSHHRVGKLLRRLGYNLQVNVSPEENNQHKKNADQFILINKEAKMALNEGQPLIYIDAKKNELVGKFKKIWRQWDEDNKAAAIKPIKLVNVALNEQSRFGLYDLEPINGLIDLRAGLTLPALTLSSIFGWWHGGGRVIFPKPKYALILIDDRGLKEFRSQFWPTELQKLADKMGLPLKVCHFPPGTKKWLLPENRLFSFVASNWRNESLSSFKTNVTLIGEYNSIKNLTNKVNIDRRRFYSSIKPGYLDNPRSIISGISNFTPKKLFF